MRERVIMFLNPWFFIWSSLLLLSFGASCSPSPLEEPRDAPSGSQSKYPNVIVQDAIQRGDFNLVSVLIGAGLANNFDLYLPEGEKHRFNWDLFMTPLTKAIENGDNELIKGFVAHGQLINQWDAYGETPLQCAVRKENIDALNILRRVVDDFLLYLCDKVTYV